MIDLETQTPRHAKSVFGRLQELGPDIPPWLASTVLLDAYEMAALGHCSAQYVYKAMASGDLACTALGRARRASLHAFQEWIAQKAIEE